MLLGLLSFLGVHQDLTNPELIDVDFKNPGQFFPLGGKNFTCRVYLSFSLTFIFTI